MPDQLAHYLFAQRVLKGADESVRSRVNVLSPVFRAGTFGPDPLFTDPSVRRRAEGVEMHRRSGREALERMRKPVKEKMPWAADYAAGFFCHYALDRLCHPYIKERSAAGDFKHVGLETAYDKRLRERGNRDMPARIILSSGALKAASRMYERVGPGALKADIEIFWQIRRFLAFGGGKKIAYIPGKIVPRLEGLMPYPENSAAIERGIEALDKLMEESLAPAIRQLNLYFECIDQKLPLDAWTDADFSGFPTKP